MYGKKTIYEKIFEKLDEIDIFSHYIDEFEEIGKAFCSEVREDNNPSCAVHIIDDLTFYKDFATGEVFNSISYVARKYGTTYNEAIEIIYNDLILGVDSPKEAIKKRPKLSSERKIISIQSRLWNNTSDKEYWSPYHLTIPTLNYFNVIPINLFKIGSKVLKGKHPMYAFKFDRGVYKILKPYDDFKWITNAGTQYYQGYDQLPWVGEHLIITSSMKDVMVLYVLGYSAIAPQSETQKIDHDFLRTLKHRFNNISLLFDNDDTGVKFSRIHYEEHGIPYSFIEGYKDPSEFIKNEGYQKTKEYIDGIFKY